MPPVIDGRDRDTRIQLRAGYDAATAIVTRIPAG